MRVLFMGGPGDVLRTFEFWRQGRRNTDIAHVGYSHQVFEACHALGMPLLALTSHSRTGALQQGPIRVEQRPDPLAGRRSLGYHAAHLALTRQIVADARSFAADVVLLNGEPYAFLLEPLRLLGVKVVQVLHCTLWPEFLVPTPVQRLLLRGQRRFYQRGFEAILTASETINRQVRTLTEGQPAPLVDFLPLFRPEAFAGITAPRPDGRPFRVIFVGRVEANKGIFDLVEIARQLRAAGRDDVVFDVCGDGGAYPEAVQRVAALGLGNTVRLHGWCVADQLRALLAESHATIVPTTRQFAEGFNLVVVESLLSGRPVITSKVCPAVEYVGAGLALVPPDDVAAYREAIVRLADDRSAYAALQARCHAVTERFLDERSSFGGAVRHVLEAIRDGRRPAPVSWLAKGSDTSATSG